MAIEVAGKRFVTLADEFFVNGAKVYKAFANGVQVYPDEEQYDINALKITYDPVESTGYRTLFVYTPGLGKHNNNKSSLGTTKGPATILLTRYGDFMYAAAIEFSISDFPTGRIPVDMCDFTQAQGWFIAGGTSAYAADNEFGPFITWWDDKSAIPESTINPFGIRVDDPDITINIIEG